MKFTLIFVPISGSRSETIESALNSYSAENGIVAISESMVGRLLGDMKRRGLMEDLRKRVSPHRSSGNLILRIKKRSKKQRRGDYQ